MVLLATTLRKLVAGIKAKAGAEASSDDVVAIDYLMFVAVIALTVNGLVGYLAVNALSTDQVLKYTLAV